jgi:hypothetical protein
MLPFTSPPTTRRITVEVFDPASIRVLLIESSDHSYLRWSDGLEDTFSRGSVLHIHGNRLLMYALPRERVYSCRLGNDVFTAPFCTRNITTEPLSSNRRLCCVFLTVHFRISGRTSQYLCLLLLLCHACYIPPSSLPHWYEHANDIGLGVETKYWPLVKSFEIIEPNDIWPGIILSSLPSFLPPFVLPHFWYYSLPMASIL